MSPVTPTVERTLIRLWLGATGAGGQCAPAALLAPFCALSSAPPSDEVVL